MLIYKKQTKKGGISMTVFEISHSSILYILIVIGIVAMLIYSGIFAKKSYARCIELGVSKEKVKDVIKSSLIFSVVPSIAIVVGLFTLVLALGIPWAWWRLSVVGSVSYELMAAEMAAKSLGLSNLASIGQLLEGKTFIVIMYAVNFGILFGFPLLIPFGKKLLTGLMKVRTSESTWGEVMNACFMLAIASVFLPIMIFSDKVSAATLATSALIAFILGIIIKKFNISWLSNFVLALTLILAMISSVGWQALLN